MSGLFTFAGRFMAVVLAFGFALGPARVASAAPVSVVVDGRTLSLDPGPIERSGRVFVPLRGIFEQLGAGVVYHNGTINATRGSSTVSLRIGSTQATVNGQLQYLDVAPFIVGASTYVPLRFVAQSFGANVGYDGANRTVAINLAPGPHPPRPYPPPVPPRPVVNVVHLRAQQPEPGSYVPNRQPAISAEFTQRVAAGSVIVTIDGNDVSAWAQRSQYSFSLTPRGPLGIGSHTIRVTGRDANGTSFDRSWSFTVSGQSAPPITLTSHDPDPNSRTPDRFAPIAATFSRNVDPDSLRVRLDGNDITSRCARSATRFSYKPPAPLSFGAHTVRVTGLGPQGGAPFDHSWSFTVSGPAAVKPPLTISQPSPNQTVGTNFTVRGNTVPDGRVRVAAGAQPGGAGNFSGQTVAGPQGNFAVNVVLKPLVGQQTVNVTITATNPANNLSTERKMALPLGASTQ